MTSTMSWPLRLQRRPAVGPGVAAVEQQHSSAALGADRLDDASRCDRARPCGRSLRRVRRNRRRSARRPSADFAASLKALRNSSPVMCGTRPLASPTPMLTDGSRKWSGTSCPCMSVRCTSVTLPSGSKRSRSACVSRPWAASRPSGQPRCRQRGRCGGGRQEIAARDHATTRRHRASHSCRHPRTKLAARALDQVGLQTLGLRRRLAVSRR